MVAASCSAHGLVDQGRQHFVHSLQKQIDVGQHLAVLDAYQHQGLPAAPGSAFKLHGVGPAHEFRTGHPHAALVKRLIPGVGDVEHAAGLMQLKRVAVLIQHVRRHCVRRASIARPQWLDVKAGLANPDHHPALARPGGAQGATLGNFPGVPGRARSGAAHQRQRGEHRRIGSAPTENDVSARFQGGNIGLGTHQGDDAIT